MQVKVNYNVGHESGWWFEKASDRDRFLKLYGSLAVQT